MSTRPNDDESDCGVIYHPQTWIPEDLRIEGGYLLYRSKRFGPSKWHRIIDQSVIRFSKLGECQDEEILDYARQFGVFQAMELKPEFKKPADLQTEDGKFWRLAFPNARFFAGEDQGNKEPLELWRYLSMEVHAILRISEALKRSPRNPGDHITTADWGRLGISGTVIPEDPKDIQFILSNHVNQWLEWGRVRLELGITEWSRTRTNWKLEINHDALAGGLAYQILLLVVGENTLYACDGCGEPYLRRARAPQPGQENFCPDCKGVAQKRANQRSRTTRKAK